MKNTPTVSNFPRWFDPRHRSVPTWAFILNRVTALGLTLYLFLHLIVLARLAQGPAAFDEFIHLAHSPLIKVGEMLVIAAGLIHGLNGIRVGLTSLGIAVPYQRAQLYTLITLAALGTIIFGLKMFTV